MPGWNHFNWLANIYDRFARPPMPEGYSLWLDLPVQGWLLDVGGGTGRISQVLKDKVENIIVGDEVAGMVRVAISKPGLKVIQLMGEALPFSAQSIDRVMMVDALHHVGSHRATIRELWRVLKPGGRILIVEPDIRTFPVKMIALVEKLTGMRSHFLPVNRIVELFGLPDGREGTQPHMQVQQEDHEVWVVIEKMVK